MLGGINVAKAPDAQTTPIANFLSYPNLNICGKATSPNITISPPITPDMAAKITATTMV